MALSFCELGSASASSLDPSLEDESESLSSIVIIDRSERRLDAGCLLGGCFRCCDDGVELVEAARRRDVGADAGSVLVAVERVDCGALRVAGVLDLEVAFSDLGRAVRRRLDGGVDSGDDDDEDDDDGDGERCRLVDDDDDDDDGRVEVCFLRYMMTGLLGCVIVEVELAVVVGLDDVVVEAMYGEIHVPDDKVGEGEVVDIELLLLLLPLLGDGDRAGMIRFTIEDGVVMAVAVVVLDGVERARVVRGDGVGADGVVLIVAVARTVRGVVGCEVVGLDDVVLVPLDGAVLVLVVLELLRDDVGVSAFERVAARDVDVDDAVELPDAFVTT